MSNQGFAVGDIDAVERQKENVNVKQEEKIEAMAIDGKASGPLKRSVRKVLFKRKTRLRKFISKGWLQIFYLNILWMIRRTYTALTFENSEDLSLPTIVSDMIAKTKDWLIGQLSRHFSWAKRSYLSKKWHKLEQKMIQFAGTEVKSKLQSLSRPDLPGAALYASPPLGTELEV
jgi:hypothetical protein